MSLGLSEAVSRTFCISSRQATGCHHPFCQGGLVVLAKRVSVLRRPERARGLCFSDWHTFPARTAECFVLKGAGTKPGITVTKVESRVLF